MTPALHNVPLRLFQGMWSSGNFLNCNVWWNCDAACRYCFSALNRKSRKAGSPDSPLAGMKTLAGLVSKVFGPGYDESRPLEFFLHERFPVLLSNNSDPFPRAEAEYGFALQYLETLAELDVPLLLLSKFPGWAALDQDKYLDVLRRFSRLHVAVTITGDNEDHAAAWEPGAPSVADRLAIVRQLADEGFAVSVQCVPFILGSSFDGAWDAAETYRPFIEQCAAAGAWGIHVAPLVFDRSDAPVLGADVKAYLETVAWSKSQADVRWRSYIPDVSIWQQVAETWYAECHQAGLACSPHNAFAGLLSDPGDSAYGLGCVRPGWESGASWCDLSRRLQQKQTEYGKPIVMSTTGAAVGLAEGLSWREHEFSWAHWRDAIPGKWMDPAYIAEVNAMPPMVTAQDVIHFQLQHMLHWSDSLWSDQCVSPISPAPGENLVTDDGNLLLYFDRNRPRDSWATCRAPEWCGVEMEAAEDAVLFDGTPAFEEVT